MFKRIALFLVTNLAIILVISIILSIFNVDPYLTKYGLNYKALLIYALIIGFTGSFISLFISKWMAMRAFNIKLIDKHPETQQEVWLVATVSELANQRKINMPDVGIYNSPEPNAFATGWNKNKALVAVSSGLLQSMDREEILAVLGHEISHVANGDMVTLTLIQGVVNTFVIFFARIAAFAVTQFIRRDSSTSSDSAIYYLVAIVFEVFFGIFATMIVMWFSRYREFRADAGSAHYVGKTKMIKALQRLQQLMTKTPEDKRAPAFEAMKIAGHSRWLSLFSSHPPIEKRIEILEKS